MKTKRLLAVLGIAVVLAIGVRAGEESILVKEVASNLSVRLGDSPYSPLTDNDELKLGPGDGLRTDASGIGQVKIGAVSAFLGPKTEVEAVTLLEGAEVQLKLREGRVRVRRKGETKFRMNTNNVSLAARGTEWIQEYVPPDGEATARSMDSGVPPSDKTHSLGTQPGQTRVAIFHGEMDGGDTKLGGGQTLVVEADGSTSVDPEKFRFKEPPADGKAFILIDGRSTYVRYNIDPDAPPLKKGSYSNSTDVAPSAGDSVVNPHAEPAGNTHHAEPPAGGHNH